MASNQLLRAKFCDAALGVACGRAQRLHVQECPLQAVKTPSSRWFFTTCEGVWACMAKDLRETETSSLGHGPGIALLMLLDSLLLSSFEKK